MTTVSATRRQVAEKALFLRQIARPTLVASIVTTVSLALLLSLAVTSALGAMVAIGIALLLVGLVCLGLAPTAEAFVILGAFLVPMSKVHPSGALSFVTAADAAFALGFGLMFPDLVSRALRVPTTFVVGAIGVFFTAVISSLLSEDPLISLNATTRLVVGAFGITVLLAWWGPGVKKVAIVAWAYVLGNVASALYAVVDGSKWSDGRRAGLSDHPNFFGLCALLGIALIPFLMTQTARPRRWILVAAGLVCFWGLWTSGSRGALAAGIAVAVAYPLLSRSVLPGLGLLAGFAVGLAFSQQLLSGSGNGSALGRLLGKGTSSTSDDVRQHVAKAAFEQFQSHPILGVGLVHPLQAHIIYLQIMAGLGVVGLLAFLLALSATVRPVVTLKPPFNLLALPALSYLLVGLVTDVLWDRYIWITLGLALLAPRLAADDSLKISLQQPTPPRHRDRVEQVDVTRRRPPLEAGAPDVHPRPNGHESVGEHVARSRRIR